MLTDSSNVIDLKAARDARYAFESGLPPDAWDPNPSVEAQNIAVLEMRAEIAGAIDFHASKVAHDRVAEGIMTEVMAVMTQYYKSTDVALEKIIQYANEMAEWIKDNHEDYEIFDDVVIK